MPKLPSLVGGGYNALSERTLHHKSSIDDAIAHASRTPTPDDFHKYHRKIEDIERDKNRHDYIGDLAGNSDVNPVISSSAKLLSKWDMDKLHEVIRKAPGSPGWTRDNYKKLLIVIDKNIDEYKEKIKKGWGDQDHAKHMLEELRKARREVSALKDGRKSSK